MASLQIIQADGSQQTIPLTKREPISIGQHASNTIVLEDPAADVLFARILWNKRTKSYEVTAAALDDIIIAGKPIRTAVLNDGDSFTVSSVKISFHKTDQPSQPNKDEQDEEAVLDLDSKPSRSTRKKRKSRKTDPPQLDQADETLKKMTKKDSGIKLVKPAANIQETSVGDWVKRARRPGERDAARSPLVTSLVFMALLLAVASGGFYLMIGKQSAQRAYDAAKSERDAGKYAQAIQRYEQFISDFPSHSLSDQSRIELSLSRIDRALSGAGGDINLALQAIEDFVSDHRQRDDYRDWYSLLAVYSSRVSIESYRQAGRSFNPELLKTGDDAKQLFDRFKATDGTDNLHEQQIKQASTQARAELLEFDVQTKTIAKMDQALEQKNVSLALKQYREGVTRYSQFAEKKEFVSRVKKTLQFEQESITTKLFSDEEKSKPHPVAAKTQTTNVIQDILLTDRRSSRFDTESDGHFAWFLVDGTFFAVDRILGELRWKKELGQPIAFEPLPVNAKYESWLISTQGGTALSLLKQDDGTTVWEIDLQSAISSQPVLIGGMLYVLTGNRQLTAVETETGQQVGQIEFPRNISAPICSLGDEQLLCIGDEDVFYFVNRQTWKCTAVRYYGHAKDTITIQPQMIAGQLLILQNDQLQSGKMQTLRFEEQDWRMHPVQTERLDGSATGIPVLWGDRLFLKTDRSIISAWHLTDTPGKPLLNRITNAPLPFSPDVKIFMQPFEGDRLLVAAESLRELTLLTNAFEQKDLSVKLGRVTQSLQLYGTNLAITGESVQEQGRVLIHYDFDEAESFWQLRLSCDPKILINQAGSQSVRCLAANGNMFDLNRIKKSNGISFSEPTERIIEMPAASSSRLKIGRVLDQKKNLAFSGVEVRLLASSGQVERSLRLAEVAQAAAATSQSIFWASKTGIHVTAWDSNAPAVSAWLSPVKKDTTKRHNWTDLVAIDNQALLAMNNRETLLGLQIREDPRRHLGESGTLKLESKAIGRGAYDGQLYWLALENGSVIAIDPRSLVINQQTKLDATPTAGPWHVGSSIFIELDATHLSARDAKQIETERWSLPLNNTPLATAPFLIDENKLLICKNDSSYLVLDVNSGKQIAAGLLPAPVSCQPILTDQTLHLGLTTGSVISISLNELLEKGE